MTIDDFAERFQAGLDAMATMPMNQARRHYDELCASRREQKSQEGALLRGDPNRRNVRLLGGCLELSEEGILRGRPARDVIEELPRNDC